MSPNRLPSRRVISARRLAVGLVLVAIAGYFSIQLLDNLVGLRIETAGQPPSEVQEESRPPKLPSDSEVRKLTRSGQSLSAEEANKLEEAVQHNPEDLRSRIRLLGYYFLSQNRSEVREARARHILWIIDHYPAFSFTASPYAGVNRVLDQATYEKAKLLWIEKTRSKEAPAKVLGNAAKFFLLGDKEKAEELLKRAKSLEPGVTEWPQQLGHLYLLQMNGHLENPQARIGLGRDALREFETALSLANEVQRSSLLEGAAKAALEAGVIDKATTYGTELLSMSAGESKTGDGNAFHNGNLVLGRVALRANNIDEARKRLLEAGRTSGSPQLNSFGPNMMLARELLLRGEFDVVIQYLDLCETFWESGGEKLKQWKTEVSAKRIPDFGANLWY